MSHTTFGPLVLVTCGGRKHATPHPAGQLYTGTYHRLCLRAAHSLTSATNIRILSARHRLLILTTQIEPYDTRLGDPDAITSAQLRAQAAATGVLDHPDVVVLAGAAYTRLTRTVWPDAHAPLAGTRGIGDQQRRLSRIATTGSVTPAC